MATADSGPLRHRYGAARDLVLGVTVVLPDGTVAKAGGKVIKNVAGYDLAKLFAGSFGTLGLIATVAVRLHPLPDADRHRARRAATTRPRSRAVARRSPRSRSRPTPRRRLGGGAGACSCASPAPRRAERAARAAASGAGLDEPRSIEDDAALWAAQRAAQRGRRHGAEGLRRARPTSA